MSCGIIARPKDESTLELPHEVAEEQNSEHIISLFRFRMRDLTPPSTKNTAALPSGCSRLLQ
jgi:hypothetical protein